MKKIDATQKSALINLMLKPLSILLGVIYTPLLLKYLEDEKFGLWSTMLSIISWINYCDIGIGQGLRNLLAKEISKKQYEEAKQSISTAYIILTIISSVLLLISLLFIFKLDWYSVFNTDVDMRIPLGISFVFICINFVLALSNTILYALQIAQKVSLLNFIIQALNIIGLLCLYNLSEGNLILVAILFGSTSMIVYLSNTMQIFSKWKKLIPSVRLYKKEKIHEIANKGIKFFIIQIACLALYTVDNLLITNLFGAEQTTTFSIVNKIFETVYSLEAALIIPYWSKTTAAVSLGNMSWIKKSIKQLNGLAIIFIGIYILLAFLLEPLAYIWLGKKLNYAPGLIVTMCIYYCLYSIVTVNTQFINGIGDINCQLVIMVIMGLTNIPLSIFFAVNCELGVTGIRLATTVLMAVAAIVFPINLYNIIKKEERKLLANKDME